MFQRLVFFLSGMIAFTAGAQTSSTSGDIYLGLRKLNVLGSVLYIAAHPDDENTRLLAYLSKDRLYRTGYLSLTRGDGGQNLIGEEQGIELGLMRTQELLAARKIDGAEQFFSRAYDFGFSKTPEETFTKWDKEKILADVVFVIRQFQPDVIITRFPTTGEGGHGHHTASAILANEAFSAAADPKRFPEQLKLVRPWQAQRILWNTFNFGSTNTQREDQFKIDVGGFNAVLGKSYGEIAAESRSQHKSQGFGVPRTRGEALEYFVTTNGSAPSKDLFDGVPVGWEKVKGGAAVSKAIDAALAGFDFLQPEKSIPRFVQIYKLLQQLPAGHWKEQKLKETKALIESASGLWLEAFATQQFAVLGDSLKLSIAANNRSGLPMVLEKIEVDGWDSTLKKPLESNRNLLLNPVLSLKKNSPVSQPFWLQQEMEEGYFNVTDPLLIGKAEGKAPLNVFVTLSIDGEKFVFEKPVQYKFTDPVRGELYQPLVVLPTITFNVDENLKLSRGNNTIQGQLTAIAKRKNSKGRVHKLESKSKTAFKSTFQTQDIQLERAGGQQEIAYSIEAQKDDDYRFVVTVDSSREQAALTEHFIKYDHIPYIHYFSQASVKNRKLDLQVKGKKIGYIVGAGDKVPPALEAMGYEVTLLGNKELAKNNLQQFDAILTGVRAYNTNEWLNNHYDKLMNYVEAGGNLIVQYNTSNQIGPVRAKIGPFPFNISRNRVTNENAAVNFTNPQHQVLHFPNKITSKDFEGWVQERSIYHATDVDKAFETVISMSDPGEPADANSLIIAKKGKGYFTYTGLVFFRELPAGVPGAYRLLANLIALNQKKEF